MYNFYRHQKHAYYDATANKVYVSYDHNRPWGWMDINDRQILTNRISIHDDIVVSGLLNQFVLNRFYELEKEKHLLVLVPCEKNTLFFADAIFATDYLYYEE